MFYYFIALFAVIETAPKINLDILQKEYKVKKGEDVTIEVKYSSTPPPKDEWFVNGTLVKKSKRVINCLCKCFKHTSSFKTLYLSIIK